MAISYTTVKALVEAGQVCLLSAVSVSGNDETALTQVRPLSSALHARGR
jgi:hypothetical protein